MANGRRVEYPGPRNERVTMRKAAKGRQKIMRLERLRLDRSAEARRRSEGRMLSREEIPPVGRVRYLFYEAMESSKRFPLIFRKSIVLNSVAIF